MSKHSSLIARNAKRWQEAELTRDFKNIARRLYASRPRYERVSAETGVPWFVIAVIHERESSQNWKKSLAQGDPWDRVSTHVPKGRGPFGSWEEAAIDALVNCAPYASKWKDWSPGGMTTLLELYNGLGYARRGLPSPYVWAGTNQYKRGKYVADGVYDPDTVDRQPGCAGLIMALQNMGAITPPPPDVEPAEPKKPTKPVVQSTEFWSDLMKALAVIVAVVTDWRVISLLVLVFCAYTIYRRWERGDIKGWFR